jgi:hypothetical protein
MGELQPGVGYNLVQSPHGDSLEILFPPQKEYGPEQFKVKMVGDKVMVAKGRVVAQALTAMPTTMTQEYDVQGFAVYPTGKLTTGTDATSVWCSQGGDVEIANANNDGTDSWGVYLIRNRDGGGESGNIDRPFLAVMADGSDAETKSKPWNTTGQHGDLREYYIIRQKQSVEITTPTEVVYGGLIQSFHGAVKRYNCQRIKVASLNWYLSTGWVITQHLIGSLYMPNNVHFYGELDYEAGDDAPDIDWPLNSAENDDWSGSWTGYDKNFNSGGLTRTAEILV